MSELPEYFCSHHVVNVFNSLSLGRLTKESLSRATEIKESAGEGESIGGGGDIYSCPGNRLAIFA